MLTLWRAAPAVLGTAGVVVLGGVAVGRIDLYGAALGLALTLVAPLALVLLPAPAAARGMDGPPVPGAPRPVWTWVSRTAVGTAATLLAALAALSLVLDRGPLAAALAAGWLAVPTVLGVRGLVAWRRAGAAWEDVPTLAALGFLAVAGASLVADRSGVDEVLGYREPYLALTAVHFHFAGLVATTLAVLAWRRAGGGLAAGALGLVVGAPAVVALGFLAVPWLLVVGAMLLTLGLYGVAWVTWRDVAPAVGPPPARVLLRVSALAVVVPMLLAVSWALGEVTSLPALSVPQMAATHGVVNAVGFSACGVLGWWLVRREATP